MWRLILVNIDIRALEEIPENFSYSSYSSISSLDKLAIEDKF